MYELDGILLLCSWEGYFDIHFTIDILFHYLRGNEGNNHQRKLKCVEKLFLWQYLHYTAVHGWGIFCAWGIIIFE